MEQWRVDLHTQADRRHEALRKRLSRRRRPGQRPEWVDHEISMIGGLRRLADTGERHGDWIVAAGDPIARRLYSLDGVHAGGVFWTCYGADTPTWIVTCGGPDAAGFWREHHVAVIPATGDNDADRAAVLAEAVRIAATRSACPMDEVQ